MFGAEMRVLQGRYICRKTLLFEESLGDGIIGYHGVSCTYGGCMRGKRSWIRRESWGWYLVVLEGRWGLLVRTCCFDRSSCFEGNARIV